MSASPAEHLRERLDQLAALTDEPGTICRTFLSPAMRRANALVGGWMKELGATVEEDGWGNLIGHFPAADPAARTLLLGSHLDTVRNAGKFDGPLGVLAAVESLGLLARRGSRLPFHVDVIGFSDEEGTRFHSAYLGSMALAGLVDPADLDLRDKNGVTVRDAVAAFQGAERIGLPAARYPAGQLLGYVEVHIEQGPVLQELDRPLGVVDHIAAQNRYVSTFGGCAGHAGTTPMTLRRDALAGAAEFVLAVEALGKRTPGLVATVGQLAVEPNVSNVIPDHARLSVDIRHADLAVLQKACAVLAEEGKSLAHKRGLTLDTAHVQGTTPTACAPALVAALDRAIARHQPSVPHLVSGAGHDGVILSRIAPVGMMFVRCRDGLSHHPGEHVAEADLGAACAALTDFLENFHP
jgi:allantoate deiminase